MNVVDTGGSIDRFRGEEEPQTQLFIRQGLREREVLKVERYLSDFTVPRLQTLADFRAAAALYRAARDSGITMRSTTDCLIAAVCVREGHPLLHADKDFDRLAGVTSLSVVDVS